MPSKLQKAIGAVKDQTSISLAKVASNNTSNLEVAILRATSHEDVPMDDRYVQEIVQLVSSSKIYAAACARAIGKRIGRTRNWIVALKSLMLVLRIFQDGDPYFPREVLHAMKRGAKILNLSSFRDDSNSSPWDFTAFIRTFALYLDERLDCFLTGKLQRRYTCVKDKESSSRQRSRGSNEPVRDMKPAMLLDRISHWQRLLERVVATRPTGLAKTNRLVQLSLYAIVQESFDFYKDISDGLALLLDSFFHLQYQNCVSAFQTCVKATKQFEELSAFYSLCKSIDVGRTSEYPSVQTISQELIETLQEFLKDQSSFPATSKSPNRPALLLPAPPISTPGSCHDSIGGQSDFSAVTEAYSERTSEFGSQSTSLEDLISATETGTSPAISIDLEAYNSNSQEKDSQRDCISRISETGSTGSCPASYSIADLTSLEDWPEENENKTPRDQEHEQKQEHKEKKLESTSPAKGWDLVLIEAMTMSAPSSPNVANSFNAFPETSISSAQSLPSLPNTSFNAFLHSATPSDQPSPNMANSFNAFPESASSSTQQLPNAANALRVFHESTTNPPAQALSDMSNTFSAYNQTSTSSIQSHATNSFDDFQDQGQRVEENGQQEISRTGWELALVETTTTTTTQHSQPTSNINNGFNTSTSDSLYTKSSSPAHHYNPFLQDPTELPTISNVSAPSAASYTIQPTFSVEDLFSSAPTFQSSPPTFSAQNPNSIVQNDDPFAVGFGAISSDHHMFHEQQLWLQNQNNIISSRKV